ncbi:hypothetical protein [Siminovitchia terrae]|uniref:hypothetical protein n=1 Tax=Siminovitchia terrae TaxID=1914933 RepID=UPI0028AED3AD|nr:hypothetical protein [Siminovitchia terrae]
MNQTLREQLRDWKRDNKEGCSKPQKRRREDLSEFEIKSLMGMDRPVYRKYRGSYRQR